MTIELLDLIGLDAFTFLHWMLAVSISLCILDFIVNTEFHTWIAFFIVLSIVYYYIVWVKILSPIIKKILLKNAAVKQQGRDLGDVAVYRIIDGNYFVEWDGELWRAASNSEKLSNFGDYEKVIIEKSELGKIFINTPPQ